MVNLAVDNPPFLQAVANGHRCLEELWVQQRPVLETPPFPTASLPHRYRPPMGLPYAWQDLEVPGLREAVSAYSHNQVDRQAKAPDGQQMRTLHAYLNYYIHAPGWDWGARDEEMQRRLDALRARAASLGDVEAMTAFLHRCAAIGIHPL